MNTTLTNHEMEAVDLARRLTDDKDRGSIFAHEAALVSIIDRLVARVEKLEAELAELRKPVNEWKKYTQPSDNTLLTVSLGDIAMSPNISDSDKTVIDAAIRVVKREAELSKRVELLDKVAKAAEELREAFIVYIDDDNSELPDTGPALDDALAALKALNERGGGK